MRSFRESLERSLEALPGVRSVSLATNLPLSSYDLRAFTPEGIALPDGTQPTTSLSWVQGPYFETLGIRLVRGRFFEPHEHVDDRRVVIVNERLASLVWPGQDAVKERLKWGVAASQTPWLTVVGVIGNVADGPLGEERRVHAYEPFRQLPHFFLDGAPNQFRRDVEVALLAEGDPSAPAAMVRREIAGLDPDLTIESIRTMNDRLREVVMPQRISTLLVSSFAAMALLLACVGLSGLLAFTVNQRQQEIAVRMALGTDRARVVRMVVGQGLLLVAVGLLAGLAGSVALGRIVGSLLYRTDPYDPATLAAVFAVLAVAACLACALPAWRASRREPMAALRAE